MKTIEKESVISKEKLIEKALKDVSEGTFADSFSIIRGSYVVTEPWNIESLNGNWLNVATMQQLIYASRVHKSSRHEVDLIVASFLSQIKTKLVNASSEEAEEETFDTDKYLSVISMSENNILIECYNIIESNYKGEISCVISPVPTLIQEDHGTSEVMLGDKTLTNYFKISKTQELSCRKAVKGYDGTFSGDEQRFPKKSNFIELRDNLISAVPEAPKKIVKFGY